MMKVSNDFYKQFEELSNKLDLLFKENKELKNNHTKEINKLKKALKRDFKHEKDELKDTITNLQNTIQKKDETIKKLIEEIDRLKNQINKNSNNSSKPSSTNIVTPKKKTGANLYNYRVKTNKKVGGQCGHKGHNLSKEKIEKLIDEDKIEVRTFIHTINGNSKKEPTVKYKIGLETKTYVEKHIFYYSDTSTEKMPSDFYTDVTYGNSIKALSIHLGCYNVIACNRLSDFFKVLSGGILEISTGTLVNFLNEFSEKSERTIDVIRNNFLNGDIGHSDETGTKFNKKKLYVRNYSNEKNVFYMMHTHKGHAPIKEDNILTRFCGGIMGDHDTTLYSYGTENYECNIHLGRYLMELMENIPDIKWPFLMYELIFRMNNTRKIAMEYGLTKFSQDKIDEYNEEFNKILELAKEENKNISSSFYKEKKAIPLYNRLVKYKKNHLFFIENFNVPFDNNLSERDLRIFKTKTKISGGFRSMKAAQNYANTLSIIKTSIKRGINPFDSIVDIFDNKVLFA